MTDPALLALRGELVVVGKSPDGDSVRFVPDQPDLLEELRRGFRAEPSEEDGSVQLRLDGIDSPETAYQGLAQPLGRAARDALLELSGFSDVELEGSEVVAATPDRRAATILSQLTDPYGRAVAFLTLGEEDRPQDGDWVPVDDVVLGRTVNAAQLRSGAAYLTLYDSTPAPLRRRLRALAERAREQERGVWARDASDGFRLGEQDDIGRGGALVLPKLFRRCTQYLEERRRGETLARWLRRRDRAGERVNDAVLVAGEGERELADLLAQEGERVSLTADLLALTFVEEDE